MQLHRGTMVDLELDELRREFLAEAEEKVREMQEKVDGDRSSESLDRLAYLAHQLKGSGGSYGFQSISTEAAELEKNVERLATGASSELEQEIRRHVNALRNEIELRARELTA